MQDINKRFDAVEDRLFAIEQKLGITKQIEPVIQKEIIKPSIKETQPAAAVKSSVQKVIIPQQKNTEDKWTSPDEPVSATRLMAWCAGFTFILAMSYFLKLVYDAGWLTPLRQIGLAYIAGIFLVYLGFNLEKRDHQYASYLPAIGLITFYLTTFTAHLYYGILDRQSAVIAVGLVTLIGIWLGRRFDNTVYVVLSAVGVYITPLLVHSGNKNLIDLVVYYSSWSLLFSFCAIQEERRITYLLPMYLAILGFDFVWRISGDQQWELAVIFQLIQFLIFSITTILFSITHQKPLQENNVLAHGLALFIFYGIEYALLKEHVPDMVNYIAVISAIFVYVIYQIANRFYQGKEPLEQGATLVSYYCSLVALHAVFFGIIPERFLPWATLMTPIIFIFLLPKFSENKKPLFPIFLVSAGLYLLGYGLLLFGAVTKHPVDAPMPNLALFIYVLMLYGIYYQFSKDVKQSGNAALALYSGHLALMACTVDLIQRDIYLSVLWAFYAVVLLLVGIARKDKVLGQSALIIFCASGLKVLLFDLSDSNSMIKVITLMALSVSLYVGGWLYQSLVRNVAKI